MFDQPRTQWCITIARTVSAAVTVVVLVAFMCGIAYGATDKDKIPVLRLEQESAAFGPVDVYVGASAVKATCTKLGFSVISSAPTWDVLVFNSVAKTGRSVSYKRWLSSDIRPGTSRLRPAISIGPGATRSVTQFQGLPCTQYDQPVNEADYGSFGSVVSGCHADRPQELVYRFVDTQPPASKAVAYVLCHFLKMPSTGGIPIISGFRQPSGLSWKLRTRRWSREAVGREFFARPEGYKQVSSFEQVIYSGNSIKDAVDALNDVKFGDLGGPKR